MELDISDYVIPKIEDELVADYNFLLLSME